MMRSNSPSIFTITFLTFLLQLSWLTIVTEGYILTYGITTTWNNEPLKPSEYVNVSFFPAPDPGHLGVYVQAPFYNDPEPPVPAGRFESLWKYEVVQVFFLGEYDSYLELMFGPKGHYVAYYLEGVRNVVNQTLDLRSYSASIIDGKMWSGRALIPTDYFPPLMDKFNAFAIHGKNESRKYLALFPATTIKNTNEGPDFHKMQFFRPLNLTNWITTRSSKFKNIDRRSTSSVDSLNVNFSIVVVQTILIFFMATFYA